MEKLKVNLRKVQERKLRNLKKKKKREIIRLATCVTGIKKFYLSHIVLRRVNI